MAHKKIASALITLGLISAAAQAHTVHESMSSIDIPGESVEARAEYVHVLVHDFLTDLLNGHKEFNSFTEAESKPASTNVAEIIAGQPMNEKLANELCHDNGNGSGVPGGGNETPVANTPIPGAAWLLGSGLLGVTAVARRKTKQEKS